MNRYVSALRRLFGRGFSRGPRAFAEKAFGLLRRRGPRGFIEIFRNQVAEESLPSRPPNRPDDLEDFAYAIPFDFAVSVPPDLRVCAVLHIFYPELCSELMECLENIPLRADVFVSTTSTEKRDQIVAAFARYTNGAVEVRVFENRGRDIAPKLVGFADVYERYDVALSLHTKKSPHGGDHLAPWRQYLYRSLAGSPQIVASILQLLSQKTVGFVFPQHYFPLRRHIHWGKNFELSRALLERAHVTINEQMELECPSGSMFWCRTDALRPLLDLQLRFADFPDETGQVDGTLAHAIERAFLYACESRGYRWTKVVLPEAYPLASTIIRVQDPASFSTTLDVVWRRLLDSPGHAIDPAQAFAASPSESRQLSN